MGCLVVGMFGELSIKLEQVLAYNLAEIYPFAKKRFCYNYF